MVIKTFNLLYPAISLWPTHLSQIIHILLEKKYFLFIYLFFFIWILLYSSELSNFLLVWYDKCSQFLCDHRQFSCSVQFATNSSDGEIKYAKLYWRPRIRGKRYFTDIISLTCNVTYMSNIKYMFFTCFTRFIRQTVMVAYSKYWA